MKKSYRFIIYIIISIGVFLSIIPFIWMIITSLNSFESIYKLPPEFIPKEVTLNNYFEVFRSVPFFKNYFINSIFVSFMVTIGTLFTTILAAFAFSNLDFYGKNTLFIILMATMMVPSEVLIAPNFVTMTKLKLINTLPALYIPWIASAFSIFLLRQYFLTIPKELYNAAKIDGCSDFKYLIKVMVPYSKPALISIALLRIINSWNEFLWPLLMINQPEKRTLPVGLTTFMTEAGDQFNYLMAYSSLVIIPVIILYIFLEKHIIKGFSRSGIKG